MIMLLLQICHCGALSMELILDWAMALPTMKVVEKGQETQCLMDWALPPAVIICVSGVPTLVSFCMKLWPHWTSCDLAPDWRLPLSAIRKLIVVLFGTIFSYFVTMIVDQCCVLDVSYMLWCMVYSVRVYCVLCWEQLVTLVFVVCADKQFFHNLGFSIEDFHAITWLTSWALSGTEEHGLTESGALVEASELPVDHA